MVEPGALTSLRRTSARPVTVPTNVPAMSIPMAEPAERMTLTTLRSLTPALDKLFSTSNANVDEDGDAMMMTGADKSLKRIC